MTRHLCRLLATGLLACGLLLTPVTSAGAAATPLRVSPAAPALRTPITVAWRAGRAAPATARYDVRLTIRPAATVRLVCSYGALSPKRRVARGGTLAATLKAAGTPVETRKWCPGPATVTVRRFTPAGTAQVVARATFRIRRGPNELPPGPRETPASIRLLAGSTITVAPAGHPERSSALNGVLRGFIPSPFRLSDDIAIARATGALVPVALAPDPLCPATSAPRSLPATSASAMKISKDGRVTLTVTLRGSGSQIAGCGPAGPLGGPTTIALAGTIGARGLLALNLDGAADGISLKLLVLVDLSDRV